jgi:predicted transcriptional regulator
MTSHFGAPGDRSSDRSSSTTKTGAKLKPSVPVKKSITRKYIVCLECGRKFKMLSHHLSSTHGISAREYLVKWNLPRTYPMIARESADRRAMRAKKIVLVSRGRRVLAHDVC